MLQQPAFLLRRILPWGLPLLVYLLLTVGMTWPLATRLTTHLPGGAHKDGLEDAYQNVWNLWWMQEAMFRLQNPLITDRLFHPEQPDLFYHTLSPATTLLAVPITARWGPIAGFNALALFSFVVGAMGAWALARDRTGSDVGALLAGIVYAWSPFHMAVLVTDGQLEMVALHWLPWYLLFLLRAAECDRRRPLLLAAFFLVLTAWTNWYYTLVLLIFTAGYALWRLSRRSVDWSSRWRLIVRLSVIGVLSSLGVAPLLIPMLIEASRHSYMYVSHPADLQRLSADLLAYFLPPRLHAWWGTAPWEWGVHYRVNRRFYLGIGALALALIGVWRHPGARRWGLAALGFGVLSLGPVLKIGHHATGIPLPYQLLASLPLLRMSRQPDRFNVLVTLALAVMVAYGGSTLTSCLVRPHKGLWSFRIAHNAGRRLGSIGLTALLGMLLISDYLPAPITTRQPFIPPFFARLPHDEQGALIEYPFHTARPYRDAERMLFQTMHQQPISGGYHSRPYPQTQLGLPVLRDMLARRVDSDIVVQAGGWRAALNTLGYRYIIGYKQQPLGPQNIQPHQEVAFQYLINRGLEVSGPDYEDQWMIVYRVPEAAPQPVVQIREGWEAVEEALDGERYRWMGAHAALGLIVPEAGAYRLSFDALPADGPRHIRFTLLHQSIDVPILAGKRRYTLLLELPEGRTLLELQALEAPTSGDAVQRNGDIRPISVRIAQIQLQAEQTCQS